MKLTLKKVSEIMIIPDDKETANFIERLKLNQVIVADFKRPRNYAFHKKYFALIKYAYENWEPQEFESPEWEGVTPEKSFDRFRKDLIILSGRYHAVYRVDGSVRIEAESISFASMNEESFAELYDSTINVILKKILTNYSRDDIDRVVQQLEGFY